MKISIPSDKLSTGEQLLLGSKFEADPLNIEAIFSDETENYRYPIEPMTEDEVQVFLQTAHANVDMVWVVYDSIKRPMTFIKTEGVFDYYSYSFSPTSETKYYYYEIEKNGRSYFYTKEGFSFQLKNNGWFQIIRNFKTPDWAKGAVMYQIYVDRFYNGDTSNDVVSNEYDYLGKPVKHIEDWNELPTDEDIRNFYGGDLQGVIDKLDYLHDLGIEAIYFNPIFVSPSNHKYDIQDYDYVDPHIGVIVEDENIIENSGFPTKYAKRTTSKANLEASNRLLCKLVEEAHKRKIRVILDGVFNHCGAFHSWMDSEKIYGGHDEFIGALGNVHSKYRDYFKWNEDGSYECWWGFFNHPKLNYENSQELFDYIMNVGRKWVTQPFNVDGWRLDVAADVGHSPEFNHLFWKKFREAVKSANNNAIILAEHYGDASSWLQGDEWDSIMNYDAFMEPISWFLTGMEKHSDYFRKDLSNNGSFFKIMMQQQMAKLSIQSIQTSMNQLSNHDHSRFLTRTNKIAGRLHTKGAKAAEENINKGIMKEAVLMQMTWPGAPTVYYGDEAGLVGWTDPDNRRSYPWGRENTDLLDFHKKMITLRKKYSALKTGSLLFLYADHGILSYARFDNKNKLIILINNTDYEKTCIVPVWKAKIPLDGCLKTLLVSSKDGFSTETMMYQIKDGMLSISLEPYSGVLLKEC